jgi:transglutaminase-like putative cysteine protease
VEADLKAKEAALPQGHYFDWLADKGLNPQEREAMEFLYAYMPLGDLTDHSSAFYLENVRTAFQARREMPWGDSIPEVVFRHFVLPLRVGNESLDSCRMVFYKELKDRVKGLSLYEAALEVNHWCHEKVIYTPSDARTASPLALIKTAYGRCGEEAVFAVAALRSVGIPARQAYTPRWAHTDDNHAWVEVWVHGRWYFMGACEPAPVLNSAWFNGPASRAELILTRVFGRYPGPEDVMSRTDNYTDINIISNYAPTSRATVTVTDTTGKPVVGAKVEFKIYNYAEFCTVVVKTTDAKGQVSLESGRGDMLVWASKGGRFGFRKLSFGKEDTLSIPLEHRPGDAFTLPIDIVPPPPGMIPSSATEAQKAENDRRMAREDSIRNAYVATFFTAAKGAALGRSLGIDTAETARLMVGARGNWAEVESFLRQAPDKKAALQLLKVLPRKDLRDMEAAVLLDHLLHSPGDTKSPLFVPYVENPRVSTEVLTPYKSFFQKVLPKDLAGRAAADPQQLVAWISKNILPADSINVLRFPVSPRGVWESRRADSRSRNIFFVAVARSLGVPARIETVTGKVQYFHGGQWLNVDFGGAAPSVPEKGSLMVSYTPTKLNNDPKYYSHFTLARVRPDGTLQTLNLESDAQVDMGAGNTWSSLFKKPMTLDAGHYLLVSGTRMAKGNVLAEVSTFDLRPGKQTDVRLLMRKDRQDIQVIGSIDAEAKFRRTADGKTTSILATTGRGYFVLAILGPRQEPTNHAMRDIAALKASFDKWGRSMVCLFKDEAAWKSYDPKEFGALPSTITYGIDADGSVSRMLVDAMKLPSTDTLPIFVIADTFGRVVFVSQGYSIGLGQQMMQTIAKL